MSAAPIRSYADFVVTKYDPDSTDPQNRPDDLGLLVPATVRVVKEQLSIFGIIARRFQNSEVWSQLRPTIGDFLLGAGGFQDIHDCKVEIVPELDVFAIQRVAVMQREIQADRKLQKKTAEL